MYSLSFCTFCIQLKIFCDTIFPFLSNKNFLDFFSQQEPYTLLLVFVVLPTLTSQACAWGCLQLTIERGWVWVTFLMGVTTTTTTMMICRIAEKQGNCLRPLSITMIGNVVKGFRHNREGSGYLLLSKQWKQNPTNLNFCFSTNFFVFCCLAVGKFVLLPIGGGFCCSFAICCFNLKRKEKTNDLL